jgi:hypothetical protein
MSLILQFDNPCKKCGARERCDRSQAYCVTKSWAELRENTAKAQAVHMAKEILQFESDYRLMPRSKWHAKYRIPHDTEMVSFSRYLINWLKAEGLDL